MKVKLVHRLPTSADRLTAFQAAVEDGLRTNVLLVTSPGIISGDGSDVDVDTAACALFPNADNDALVDASPGTVVFPNGEVVTISSTDLVGIAIDSAESDAQVIRLEYGDTAAGPITTNPFYNFATQPSLRAKTPAEMVVVETVASYNSQPADIKALSVVLGVVRATDSGLSIDNGRDTYAFSRPWASPVDVEHRSKVGTGVVTDQNPHGISFNDQSVGTFSAWQALAGGPAVVLSRPVDLGRLPGKVCSANVPAGNFLLDSTGLVTGKAGARYANFGDWGDRLLYAAKSNGTEVAAWIPRGKPLIAVFDPAQFSSAADLTIYYTRVGACALPGSTVGLTSIELESPGADEAVVAGGNLLTSLSDNKVFFTDVGVVPMYFDLYVDGQGKAYKSPDVVLCNTKLNSLGSAPFSVSSQPRAPSRLRIALSGYNPGLTEVKLQVSGSSEGGGSISEQVTFTGPLSAAVTGYSENADQRRFTLNSYASISNIQVLVRNGDGANTAVTVFAEGLARAPLEDDLLAGTVWWNGAEVSTVYGTLPTAVLDRRVITTGGQRETMSALAAVATIPMPLEGTATLSGPSPSMWVTVAEDFGDPHFFAYPQTASTTAAPVDLAPGSTGIRKGYVSRKIPWGVMLPSSLIDASYFRMIPARSARNPLNPTQFSMSITFYATDGTSVTRTASTPTFGTTSVSAPIPVSISGGALPSNTYFASKVAINRGADMEEVFQGFVLHLRDNA